MPEVAVMGSGLVGLSFCLAARHYNLPIALHLFDAHDPTRLFKDRRPLVLGGYSQYWLQTWGLWPLLKQHAYPLQHLHVSAKDHAGCTHLHAADHDLDALGWVIPAGLLYQRLFEALDQAQVSLHMGHALSTVNAQHDGVQLSFEGQASSQHFDWLVAADGASSSVRQMTMPPTDDDGVFYATVFANVRLRHQGAIAAHQRFTPHGSVALLPLADDRATIVWTQRTRTDDASVLWQHTLEAWQRRMHIDATSMPKPIAYQGTMMRPKTFARDRVLLLGNAAHVLPPIAAQGFNLGLRDATALAALWSKNQSFDLASCYQAKRTPDIQRTYEACLHAMQAFEPWHSELSPWRSTAFWMLSSCSILQRLWLGYGSGFYGGMAS